MAPSAPPPSPPARGYRFPPALTAVGSPSPPPGLLQAAGFPPQVAALPRRANGTRAAGAAAPCPLIGGGPGYLLAAGPPALSALARGRGTPRSLCWGSCHASCCSATARPHAPAGSRCRSSSHPVRNGRAALGPPSTPRGSPAPLPGWLRGPKVPAPRRGAPAPVGEAPSPTGAPQELAGLSAARPGQSSPRAGRPWPWRLLRSLSRVAPASVSSLSACSRDRPLPQAEDVVIASCCCCLHLVAPHGSVAWWGWSHGDWLLATVCRSRSLDFLSIRHSFQENTFSYFGTLWPLVYILLSFLQSSVFIQVVVAFRSFLQHLVQKPNLNAILEETGYGRQRQKDLK
ncbi:splicing factor 3B subunit 4-like [Falco peregrinus]|uniref:splicing factor 3B subunit 4-like n=1 Tax=Falco peregrinus TaxID=8954 RepID=UPI00247A5AE1|nr:splicing factor 3B subunit 4-like [Falco peregrinus]